MPSCPSLSRSLASTLQCPPLNHHSQVVSKPFVHLLSVPHLLSPPSPTVGFISSTIEDECLANAAAEAASVALQLARALTEVDLCHGFERRRECLRERRRQRRRSGVDIDAGEREIFEGRCCSKSERSSYLTRDQEAEFSSFLKVESMAEDPLNGKASSCVSSRMGRRRKNERALLRARECRERIALSYKRLVVSVASAYQGKGLSLQDLIQEGSIGLLHGAQRFDYRKGTKMSTYVYWWIRQAIMKGLAKNSNMVRLPGYLCPMNAKVAEAKSLLRDKLKRLPTYEEIAEVVGISTSSVRLISQNSRHVVSIDQPINGENITLKDIIQGPDERRPESMFNRQQLVQNMEMLLKTLDGREEYIMRSYYGINGENSLTFEEIGRSLNLSRERIRQIHYGALARLKEGSIILEGLTDSVT